MEAVRQGAVELAYHNSRQRRVLKLPEGLRRELLDYAEREGIRTLLLLHLGIMTDHADKIIHIIC